MTIFVEHNPYFWGTKEGLIEASDAKEYSQVPESRKLVAKLQCKHRTVWVPKRDSKKNLPDEIQLPDGSWMLFECNRCNDDKADSEEESD